MPIHEYKCKEPGQIFAAQQKMSDPLLAKRQICDSEVERLIGRPTIFCKNSDNSPYQKDFPSDPRKWGSVGESAFGATKKDKEEIRKNWNKKESKWV